MKPFLLLLFSILSILFVCCNSANDPYDEGFPAEKWTPTNLKTEVSDSGVWLSWVQKIETIDGFIIERSQDSLDWEFLSTKMLKSAEREYLDSNVATGGVYFYRLYAKADNYESNYCYSNAVVVPLQLPTVSTYDATEIDSLGARLNGAVIKDGGRPVSERGFCYGTATMPTIKNEKISVNMGIGAFTSNLSNLECSTLYYYRAYATNENGTSYGEQKSFKTKAKLPRVKTYYALNIDSISADFKGEIIYDGGSTLSEYGFCYSLNSTPKITDIKVISSTGAVQFGKTVSGLLWHKTYHVRAYAINESGISYGNEIGFYTHSDYKKYMGSFMDDRDGKVYKTITLGSQTWMAENLAYLPSVSSISQNSYSTNNYYVYDYFGTDVNEAKANTNFNLYGVLYNWPAALSSCPKGWHLPNSNEWSALQTYLITNGFNYDGTVTENKIAKSLAFTAAWDSSGNPGAVGNFLQSNNSACFFALPGGYFTIDVFSSSGHIGRWWSSSNRDASTAFYKDLSSAHADLGGFYDRKLRCLSVRCVKD